MDLLRMSIAGAAMILAVTVIRALTLYRLPKRTFMALWGIVLARLLVPFSVPSSLSIYTLFMRAEPVTGRMDGMAVTALESVLREGQMTAASNASSSPAAAVPLWMILWAAGALICAGIFLIAYWKCYSEFQASLPLDNDFTRRWLNSHQIKRPIQIRQSDLISAPLTFGIFRPVILMPKATDWDDEKALQYVFAHEFVHIRRFDTITKLILLAAVCAHWFNPFVWVMYVLANRDMELSCDEAVLRLFGACTRASYARTLIGMEEQKSGIAPLCSNFSKNALEERMTAIMKTRKSTILSITLAALIVAGTTTAFATSAKQNDSLADSAALIEKTYTADGKTYYVLWDGSTVEESEYLKEHPTPDIEWWTYEEYRDWLENEKKELQSLLGATGKMNGEKFTWTQEKIDEAIAMYEDILQEIKNGVKYSKSVHEDGAPQLVLNMGTVSTETSMELAMDSAAQQDFTQEDVLKLYGAHGISFNKAGEMLFQGELVRLFWDAADTGDGTSSSSYQYYNGNGTVDVHTVRRNSNTASLGDLIDIEKDSQEVFDSRNISDYLSNNP